MKPATAKAWTLRGKLEALAERGYNGERTAAQHKLSRLLTRFDWSKGRPADPQDLFAGTFRAASGARPVFSFGPAEYDLGNAVKWSIETACRIRCAYRGSELVAEGTPETIRRLGAIAGKVSESFRVLVGQFTAVPGVLAGERSLFVRGLYDGMMRDDRQAGELLPAVPARRAKRGQKAAAGAGLKVHPYTLALDLGRQIRFSASVADLSASLERGIKGEIQAP